MKDVTSSIELSEKVDPSWKIGIVHSSFYKEDVEVMYRTAQECLAEMGVPAENIALYPVSGSFEIPLLGATLAQKGLVDGLIGFGIVVQGETGHADMVAKEAARGMMDVQIRYQIPFVCEVLHVSSLEEAQQRCVNKGKSAALTVSHSLAQLALLRY